MLKTIFKKFFGKESKEDIAEEKSKKEFQQKLEKFYSFFGTIIERVQNEYYTIKEKCQNLRETNYDLGLAHLEKENFKDAIFRFKIIIRFWPDFYDAYYQLAYCYAIVKKYQKSKKILEELLQKQPNYPSRAQELLTYINQASQQ